MNSSIKKMLIVFIAAMLTFGNAFARGGGGKGMMRMLDQLELTEKQKETLTTLRESSRDQFKEMHAKKRELREKLSEGFKSDLSADELRKLHKAMQSISQALADLRFENHLKIREVLTVEQRKKFQEMKDQKKQNRKGRRGGRGGMGDQGGFGRGGME